MLLNIALKQRMIQYRLKQMQRQNQLKQQKQQKQQNQLKQIGLSCKYVYLIPQGGLNDILSVINRMLKYCKTFNRILLVDTTNTHYKINLANYFGFPNINNIICDKNKIIEICNNTKLRHTIYPACLNNTIQPLLSGKNMPKLSYKKYYTYDNVLLTLPYEARPETIIFHSEAGGGDGYLLFQQMSIKPFIKIECKKRYDLVQKPYLCIQVRNTDYKSNYKQIYDNNRDLIHLYHTIYLATDDKSTIEYYKTKYLPFINFTTFPIKDYHNLHQSDVDSHTKIIDLICDIYMISMSDKLLSNSIGGFIHLVRKCFNNKDKIGKQYNL